MNQEHVATVRIAFGNPDDATAALESLAPDNDGHLEALTDGPNMVLTASSESIMGLLRTLDDAMGCLRATGIE